MRLGLRVVVVVVALSHCRGDCVCLSVWRGELQVGLAMSAGEAEMGRR
jgi:hypothetical protein